MTDESNAIIVNRDEYRTAARSQWPITEEEKRADHSGLFSVTATPNNNTVTLFTVPAGFIGIINFLYYENVNAGAGLLTIADASGNIYIEINQQSSFAVIQNGESSWEAPAGNVTVTSSAATPIVVNGTYFLVPST